MTQTTSTFGEHAAFYASKGFPVFPLQPRSKDPLKGSHAKDDATTDVEQVRAWWQTNPDYNVAIRPPEGVIVLDVDPRNGGDLGSLGILPQTLTAATGGGGWHLWYQHSGPVRGKVPDVQGIDIKTGSGYLVAPPSIHPDTGVAYRWADRSPVAVLPRKLAKRIGRQSVFSPRPAGILPSSPDALVRFVGDSQEGERNNRLFWAACRAVEQGADHMLPDIAAAAMSTGLEAHAVDNTIKSAINTQPREGS